MVRTLLLGYLIIIMISLCLDEVIVKKKIVVESQNYRIANELHVMYIFNLYTLVKVILVSMINLFHMLMIFP